MPARERLMTIALPRRRRRNDSTFYRPCRRMAVTRRRVVCERGRKTELKNTKKKKNNRRRREHTRRAKTLSLITIAAARLSPARNRCLRIAPPGTARVTRRGACTNVVRRVGAQTERDAKTKRRPIRRRTHKERDGRRTFSYGKMSV